jgi:Ethanolamine utilization protein EutJ (predicted chaperonin)
MIAIPAQMPPDHRRVLGKRSIANKIAIAIDCDMCPVADLPVIAQLVRDGYIVWIDRCALEHVRRTDTLQRLNVDVYQLTAKGAAYCDTNGVLPK